MTKKEAAQIPLEPDFGALQIFWCREVAQHFVTNTTIMSSANHGIERAWRSLTKIDFLATNTFEKVAKCNQTFPKDPNGACPTNPPCPK